MNPQTKIDKQNKAQCFKRKNLSFIFQKFLYIFTIEQMSFYSFYNEIFTINYIKRKLFTFEQKE